jgi:hypothetical protein
LIIITTNIYPMCLLNNLGNDGWAVGSWSVRSWAIRSRHNNWGRGIRSWCWGISWGRCVDGLSRVLDISNIAIAISSVGDSLETTIGKVDVVFSIGVVTFTCLTGSKVGSTVCVRHSIVVVVGWNSVGVGGLSTISWGRGISWGWGIDWGRCVLSRSSSHKSKQSNKGLKSKKNKLFTINFIFM